MAVQARSVLIPLSTNFVFNKWKCTNFCVWRVRNYSYISFILTDKCENRWQCFMYLYLLSRTTSVTRTLPLIPIRAGVTMVTVDSSRFGCFSGFGRVCVRHSSARHGTVWNQPSRLASRERASKPSCKRCERKEGNAGVSRIIPSCLLLHSLRQYRPEYLVSFSRGCELTWICDWIFLTTIITPCGTLL